MNCRGQRSFRTNGRMRLLSMRSSALRSERRGHAPGSVRNGSLRVTTVIALVLKRRVPGPVSRGHPHPQVIVWRILFLLSSSFAGDPEEDRARDPVAGNISLHLFISEHTAQERNHLVHGFEYCVRERTRSPL